MVRAQRKFGEARAPAFAVGDAVHVSARPALGHCRTPFFLRGKSGVVVEVHGVFRNPEQLAYHLPGLPAEPLYKVRFRQTDVWRGYTGPKGDTIEVDVYEHWLEKAR